MDQIIHQGWLNKAPPPGPMKRWKKRLFLLVKDHHGNGAKLDYYTNAKALKDEKPKGTILIRECSAVEAAGANAENDAFKFVLIHPARVYLLAAEREHERDQWLHHIERLLPERTPLPPRKELAKALEIDIGPSTVDQTYNHLDSTGTTPAQRPIDLSTSSAAYEAITLDETAEMDANLVYKSMDNLRRGAGTIDGDEHTYSTLDDTRQVPPPQQTYSTLQRGGDGTGPDDDKHVMMDERTRLPYERSPMELPDSAYARPHALRQASQSLPSVRRDGSTEQASTALSKDAKTLHPRAAASRQPTIGTYPSDSTSAVASSSVAAGVAWQHPSGDRPFDVTLMPNASSGLLNLTTATPCVLTLSQRSLDIKIDQREIVCWPLRDVKRFDSQGTRLSLDIQSDGSRTDSFLFLTPNARDIARYIRAYWSRIKAVISANEAGSSA
eukprot:TRINITY_DN11821_c0_g1_i2.p2 TRINITY_DN11821_c0_g1~~TRINITY_DN11821_c0_g1_i2.p2  ORF type:complete len:441 (+),score=64.85 TRINITY_DN11821_c0_g1_i2:2908-4230(+)